MGKLAVAAIVSMWVVPISILVNRIVPEPYMDEIFHIPQAQRYCEGNFRSWDPMITTPPGLYYLSLAHVASLFPGMSYMKPISSFSEVCSIPILRSVNVVLAVTCSIIVYDIVNHLRPTLDDKRATLCAVVLALYPLHWFFTFLYYTDVASLTAVLAMYLASLKKKHLFSALLGAFAVFIRQTNVVWVLFVACSGVINITLGKAKEKANESNKLVRKSEGLSTKDGATALSNVRKRKSSAAANNFNSSTTSIMSSSTISLSGFLDEVQAILLRTWRMKFQLVVSFSPFFVILAAFVAFAWWNGGIVLGAKEAHTVSPHFAQVLYFSLVSVLAMTPLHFGIRHISSVFQSMWKDRPASIFQVLISLTAGILSVHFFSIAHPYLLADNRHYPFYLWRKVINAHWCMKYLLVPFYVYSWLSIVRILGKNERKIWVLAYFLASAAALIPAPLIEFRYYTIPFYLLALHSVGNETVSWLLMGLGYIAINTFTMTMFLYRPFHWDHEPGTQRFIW
ncbi:Alpha-2-glucosyltransferase Alg10 [Dillenia turbinata]|uniref:Dol-P-Glc:Glc(2)Man(9)GlcNAc(2)-PP-Dol alpha-1,2-glucosyltransferase n=1 Tax=Dillenia turbinata TaxID=194707 RepID=A0AAN8ZRD2_9MAGN